MIIIWKVLVTATLLTSLVRVNQSYNIGLLCAVTGSHVIMMGHLADHLVKKGHDVTLIVPSVMEIPHEIPDLKIHTIVFPLKGPMVNLKNVIQQHFLNIAVNPSLFSQMKLVGMITEPSMMRVGYSLLEDTTAMNKLVDKKLDFMIIDPIVATYLLVPYKLGIPFAIYHHECFDHIRRIPVLPSVTPHTLAPYSEHMTFLERLGNLFYNTFLSLMFNGVTDMSTEHIPELPAVGFVDMLQNASLCLLLRDSVTDVVRPLMPDVIPVATLMGRPAKPLKGDLRKFMDSSPQGVIFMSFGTVVGELPIRTLKAFFAAFEQIDHRVIFKYKHQVDDVPANVHIIDWVSQNDLLGHPNMKLFITHCGMNSYIEAVYQGVPLLAMPFALDQHGLAALVKSQGIGDVIHVDAFTSEELTNSINLLIGDARYKNTAVKLSTIYKEIRASGLRDPAFWIEHVIKYGASHLRSHAYDMPFYQYAGFDVSVFLVACGLLVATTVFLFCRCITTALCGKAKGKEKKNWFPYHSVPLLCWL